MEAAYAKLIDAIRDPERDGPGIIGCYECRNVSGTASAHIQVTSWRILLAAGPRCPRGRVAALLAS